MADNKSPYLNSVLNPEQQEQRTYDANAKLAVNVDISLCTPEEEPRMISIVNRLAQSEAGRETLEIAAKAGYKLGFLDAATNCFGCCFGGSKYIGLGPMATDDKLVGTLCHECRHAGQDTRMREIPGRHLLNVASIIRVSRAKEADAQAYALKACKELEMQGDKGPLAAFAKFYPPIFDAFEKSFAKNGELNKQVVADTFKGWYDQGETKQNYEEGYIIDPMHAAVAKYNDPEGKGSEYYFAHNITSPVVVTKIGWTKDGNYLSGEDSQFLNEDRFLSIGERTKYDAEAFFKIREEKTGRAPDASLASMPTYKDAFERKSPEMGKATGDKKPIMDMGKTLDKWKAILAAKSAQGR